MSLLQLRDKAERANERYPDRFEKGDSHLSEFYKRDVGSGADVFDDGSGADVLDDESGADVLDDGSGTLAGADPASECDHSGDDSVQDVSPSARACPTSLLGYNGGPVRVFWTLAPPEEHLDKFIVYYIAQNRMTLWHRWHDSDVPSFVASSDLCVVATLQLTHAIQTSHFYSAAAL